MAPKISIIVPSRNRAGMLGRMLDCLARQKIASAETFEVIVALDGEPGDGSEAMPTDTPFDLKVIPLEPVGISAAKNVAVTQSRGQILLLVNDDIEPEPAFVHEHCLAHAAGHRIVLGDSPWARFTDQTIFDQLITHSRMVFFYQHLQDGQQYDFRHAWNLNLSVDRALLQDLQGPFAELLRPVYFDDVEMAHRLMDNKNSVYFHAAARATHNHRYTPRSYFLRETLLGLMAVELNTVNRGCFETIFRTPLQQLGEQARQALALDTRDGQRCLEQWTQIVNQPCDNQTTQELIDTLYLAHLPLKRRAFRRGLIEALDRPDTPWQQRFDLAKELLNDDPVFSHADWPHQPTIYPPTIPASPLRAT